MLAHLAMTGGFLINKLHKHERIVFELSKVTLYFRDIRKMGCIKLFNADELMKYLAQRKLGVDALNSNKYEIEAQLINKVYDPRNKDKAIKEILLDQTIISGLGNIYSNEVLHSASVNPLKTPKEINWTQIKDIAAAIPLIVNKAVSFGGSSIKDYTDVFGNEGKYQTMHSVYGRNGKYCRSCGDSYAIKKVEINKRSTFYCPNCQH